MRYKFLIAALLLLACTDGAMADNGSTYHGPPYGPGTAIPVKPQMGPGSPVPPGFFPGGTNGFSYTDRGTIGDYFRSYWLCPACGYTGSYVPYQVGGYIGGGTYAPFPSQLLSQLPAAPPGTIYVFANQNALLVAQGTGQILDIIPLNP